MDFIEFKSFLTNECQKNNIKIEEDKIENLYVYMKKILEWNEKINLTAIKDEKEFIIKHFIDSLTLNKYIKNDKKVIDIGTGAGFPGIPLKISNQTIDITLIDSINKKLNVIREINKDINLEKIDIIHARAEDLANNEKYRETFDIATTRAVSNLTTILEYMLPFLKIGGQAICMKGPGYKEELEQARKAIDILGGRIKVVENIIVSDEFERNIIIIEKIKNTPKKYPRGQGKPLKEPIM